MRPSFDPSLYLVTDSRMLRGRLMTDVVMRAIEGGVTMVQLRDKEASTLMLVEQAAHLKDVLRGTGVPLLINDRIDVAMAVNADGVHIGQSDMPYAMARTLLGADKLIGLSVENDVQLLAANALNVDYVALSPVFATPTKTDTASPFGLDGIRRAATMTHHTFIGIGGLNNNTAKHAIAAGLDGIAVVSAIMVADDPKAAAEQLRYLIRKTKTNDYETISTRTHHSR